MGSLDPPIYLALILTCLPCTGLWSLHAKTYLPSLAPATEPGATQAPNFIFNWLPLHPAMANHQLEDLRQGPLPTLLASS